LEYNIDEHLKIPFEKCRREALPLVARTV